MNKRILPSIPAMWYGNPSPVCYVGSVMRLMEYIGEPIEEDELIALSGVGLCFPWRLDSICDEVSIIPDIPSRTFGALGYDSEYFSENVKPNRVVPGTVEVGTWPLPEGTYDPGLDGCGINDGTKIYGLFDAGFNKLPAPASVEGYDQVDSIAKLSGKSWFVLNATSGYDYVLVSGADDKETDGRMYSKEFYLDKIKASINANRPVIGFGITDNQPYTCLIVGYDDGGLYTRAFWPPNGESRTSEEYFYSTDWFENCAGILVVGAKTGERLKGEAAYKCITDWALHFRMARSRPVTANGMTYPQNEAAFGAMCEWLLNDAEWQDLTSHEVYLKQSGLLLVGYYRNNLYSYLKRLDAEYPGVVNPPAFAALERMSKEFPGSHASDLWLNECVDPAITDFSMLRERSIREKVERWVSNNIGDCDNGIQWALFMPDFVKKNIRDADIDLVHFEYRTLPAFRFVGIESDFDNGKRAEIVRVLDAMTEYASGFDYDITFVHHYGRSVDDDPGHSFMGRFMKVDTPAPEGFVSFDFLSPVWSSAPGLPYLTQFAFAVFAGESDESLHKSDGFDANAMYDITRNIILGEDVMIPYPDKYWTAEVRFDRCDGGEYNPENLYSGGESGERKIYRGFLFSVNLDADGGGK